MANKLKLASKTRIYVDTRRLLDEMIDITVNFPRAYKYSIGSRMRDISITLLLCAAKAYMEKDLGVRIRALTDFQTSFEVLKTLVRIAGERKWISLGRHAHIAELMESIGRQSTAWKNSLISVGENCGNRTGQG
jgi:hypothetical protein